ncbi:MAG: SIMPL domain-containing protein, partial [Pyrinomonadaceae bacterium]
MLRKLIAILGVLALLTLSAPQNTLANESEKEITVRGWLQRTVEPGGWLVVAERQKYLILNAQQFQKEDWFNEGKEVEATGETRDVMTTHMEGTPLEVKSLRPLAGASGAQNQQVTGGESKRLTRVVVSGDSIVRAQPDTAVITISVVTQSKQALAAQQENATRTEAVVRALKAAAGAGAEVKTSGYSLQP